MQPFRIQPTLPAAAMKTYRILAPASTHFRPATCAEVNCAAHANGWQTLVDESTDLGQKQAHYIRRESRRGFTETRDPGGATVFTFKPGQRCFRAGDHRIRLDRQEIYVVQGGDWRGNPRGESRRHSRPADWVDDFAEHQDQLATRLQQG